MWALRTAPSVELTSSAGPAHAVYFLTYENVKHATGGNESGYHILSGCELSASNTQRETDTRVQWQAGALQRWPVTP